MADDTPTRNIALLIDADNASWHAIDPVLTVLAELGTVNVRRVYGNWSKQSLKGWRDMTVKHGIEPQQQFDLTKGKNATDMKMTIDAMDLLFRGRVEGFGIMSSDSDFMPLAMRIRQDGLPVYGFGESRTPEAFKRACTRFIDVAALTAVEAPPAPSPAAATATAPAASTATPAARPASDVSIEQSLPPAISSAPRRKKADVDPELLQLLVDAYDSVKRDERGFVSLSAMGQLAGNRSSFDARNYGYRRLADLIEAVPNFQTELREGGRLYVKRVR
ncbi:OST-HTH/LOTUS domain-containing protein [Sphingomonas gellani]|uniref:OST-HTH/LOTUS domain-containing protein n=1 Tax=Sphingomonas gellani TaxID=1166340 RepID=A0A1H7ZW05_9SPHN|nr:NYN domain-containing protein [Sphingomonas gellani]SEM61934.1 OST-HTH/LOTUS domain-containing protein [Sphingomonas gellani]